MNVVRRLLLQGAGVLVAGLVTPLAALAATWNKQAFGAKTSAEALKGIGAAELSPSNQVSMDVPEIAENGAVVPVEITSRVPGTTSIAVVIDKNPFPLTSRFDFMEGALPYVKLNVKMGQSSNIRVIAEAGGKHYVAMREVKVTIGGCGG